MKTYTKTRGSVEQKRSALARGRRSGTRSRCLPWFRVATVLAALASLTPDVSAQSTVSGNPCEGQNGFVIKDAKTGQTVSRGRTTSRGSLNEGVVLGANKTFSMTVANGNTGTIGSITFTTGDNGSSFTLPRIDVGESIARDSDRDGVPDDIEDVFGTNPRNPSTGGGGISDKALITAPTDPGTGALSIPNNPAFGPPGIIGSVQLPGNCVDICTFNDVAVIACLDRGVSIFNIFGGLTPRQIAMVDTPGEARAVACLNGDVAVADGLAGLAIVDIRNPSTAAIRAQIPLGGYAESVAAVGGTAYVGLRNGQLAVVDLISATEIQRLNLGAEVFDVTISGDFVWAVAGNNLRAFTFTDGILSLAGSVALSSIGPDPLSGRKRLFVGGGWAQVATSRGFDNVDVRNPSAMMLVGRVPSTGPGSFKQIIANGSGIGIAPVGVNPRADGTHDINLYNLNAPANVSDLLTTLRTPGTAYASSLYNGFVYIADGERGLQVLRYLDTDLNGMPPVVSLSTSASAGQAEEGKLFRLTAQATDDVQVRNTEFYLDGELVGTDGNFPFELFFNAPLRTAAKDNFTARARAFDMAGNSSWSDPVTVQLGPDMTPPLVTRTQPAANTIVGSVDSVLAFFSEPIRTDSVVPESFRLIGAGADRILGTADDLIAPPGVLSYQDSLRAAVWSFPTPLAPGLWQGIIGPPLADRGGRMLERTYRWNFILFNQPDRDRDGAPDALEPLLGLDPDNPDTRVDGVRDGDRDFDNDLLSNAAEVLVGSDPRNRDTDGDGTLDGNEDNDLDGLSDGREVAYGANPLVADTDGDRWNDESEVTGSGDPVDPLVRPKLFFTGYPLVRSVLPVFAPGEGSTRGVTVGQPLVALGLPVFSGLGGDASTVMGQPLVRLGLPGLGTAQAPFSTLIGKPPVRIGINSQ